MAYITCVNNEFRNNVVVSEATAGTTASLMVENEDNSNVASHALAKITTGGSSAGDPFVHFYNNVASTTLAMDNSDSDAFVISLNATPGTTNVARCSLDGEWTYPLQSSFFARLDATVENVTGDGTVYTPHINTEHYDQNSDFNTGTYTFTAPKDGVYVLIGNVTVTGTTTMGNVDVIIQTTTIGYYSYIGRGVTSGDQRSNCAIVVWMDAADTAYLRIATSGEAGKTDDIYQSNDTLMRTYFCGALLQ